MDAAVGHNRRMWRAAVAVIVTACGAPSEPVRAVDHGSHPTLASDADMYNTRIVSLRTSLGRAVIDLEARGVDRVITSASMRCTLAGNSRAIDGAALEAVVSAFDRYPSEVLQAASIEHVALCRRIDGQPDIAGSADLHARRMMINLDPFANKHYDVFGAVTAEDIVHHELYHLLESQLMPEVMTDDPAWPAFGYTGAFQQKQPGFVNTYATTAAVEDRASVFEYVMARPDELCELARSDEVLRKKVGIVWHRAAQATGDAFLRARAACVDWIDPR